MSTEIHYITPEDLSEIVDAISSFEYLNKEEIPNYDAEQGGIDNYFSLVDRLKSDIYYPTLLDKATGLFLYLNTSHYFSNGNKRIAVFSLITFLECNSMLQINLSKQDFTNLISKILRNDEVEDFPDFTASDFAMYNLAIITAKFNSNGVDFDDAKSRVREFLHQTFKLI